MGSYIPSTPQQRQEMLKAIGLSSFRELYGDVPAEMYLDRPLNIPSGMSELEVGRAVRAMADRNRVYDVILRGAGAYDHYIPSIVKYIPAKEEFLTAYTPYQAEMSQGLLQSIFEYQTMICMLTGMDVSNASVYDGATAAAEAAATPYIMASVAPWASMFTEKGISSLKANMQPLSAVYNMRVNSSPSAVSTPFSMP